MGRTNLLLVLLLFLLLILVCSPAPALGAQPDKHAHKHSGFSQAECPAACKYRCSKTQYKKPCLFFCQKCCFKCQCVPPGTYAHKEACPCYNNWKTKRGGPKCP